MSKVRVLVRGTVGPVKLSAEWKLLCQCVAVFK